jgi:hypothetical protein
MLSQSKKENAYLAQEIWEREKEIVELRDRIANDSNDGKFVLGFDKSECQ